MSAIRLFVKLTLYYLILVRRRLAGHSQFPGTCASYLPVGGAEAADQPGAGKSSTLEAAAAGRRRSRTLGQSLGWMAVAIVGALITALPVSWVYMGDPHAPRNMTSR